MLRWSLFVRRPTPLILKMRRSSGDLMSCFLNGRRFCTGSKSNRIRGDISTQCVGRVDRIESRCMDVVTFIDPIDGGTMFVQSEVLRHYPLTLLKDILRTLLFQHR